MTTADERAEDKRLIGYLVACFGETETRKIEAGVRQLRQLSSPLHRLYEVECNRSFTPAEESKRDSLEQAARDVAKKLGIHVRFNRDPRGYPIRLTWTQKSGERQPYNNWGGEDWGM